MTVWNEAQICLHSLNVQKALDQKGLLPFLRKREFGNRDTSCMDQLIQSRIRSDQFFAYELTLGDNVSKLSCNKQFLAYNRTFRREDRTTVGYSIELVDISARLVLWTYKLEYQQAEQIESIHLLDEGIILAGVRDDEVIKAYIFSEGMLLGNFDARSFNLYTSVFICNSIFVQTSSRDRICAWDLNGVKKFDKTLPTIAAASNHFFQVLPIINQDKTEIKILVLDPYNNKKSTFLLKTSSYPIDLGEIVLTDTTLVCGLRLATYTPDVIDPEVDLEILELDLLDGQIKKTHMLRTKDGNVRNLSVSKDYIVFITSGKSKELWSINRRTEKQKCIMGLPSDSQELKLFLNGPLLNVTNGRHWLFETLYVSQFDLTSKCIRNVTYTGSVPFGFHFYEGRFMITSVMGGENIYIEDFLNNTPFEHKLVAAASSENWVRTVDEFVS